MIDRITGTPITLADLDRDIDLLEQLLATPIGSARMVAIKLQALAVLAVKRRQRAKMAAEVGDE